MLPRKVVTAKVGEVRSDPNRDGVLVAGLNQGEVVSVIDTEANWHLIESLNHSDPIVGWVSWNDVGDWTLGAENCHSDMPECKCFYKEIAIFSLLIPVLLMSLLFFGDRLSRRA